MKYYFASTAALLLALPLVSFATSQSPATPTPAVIPVSPSGSVGSSPWGAEDELGRLNMMTDESRAAILSRIDGGAIFDLAVDYFIGMPGWFAAGDPRYTMWMTHTPKGTEVDDPMGVGDEANKLVSYTGSAVSMYSHTGTHIDALNHFGLNGKIFNGFESRNYLGDRGWQKTGAETIPPIVARGVLIDVAAAKNATELPSGYAVEQSDIEAALKRQRTSLNKGDVVMIHTGRMKHYENTAAYMHNPPGLGFTGAKFLADNGAMIIGADNLSLEAFPSKFQPNYVSVHTYLLAEKGIPIMELVDLQALAKNKIYEFAFIGGSLKLRGADAAPMRPIALPVK